MKIIFGILASSNDNYDEFKNIWTSNINKFKSGPTKNLVDFYFIYTEPQLQNTCIDCNTYYNYYSPYIENDSMMNSFVKRTISLLDHLEGNNTLGDFFIRTNLSTLFDLNMLLKWAECIPKNNIIAGSVIDKLNSIHTQFSGTNIILTRDLVQFLLLNQKYILDESILSGDDQRISSLIVENIDVRFLIVKRLDFIELESTKISPYIAPHIVFQNSCKTINLFCYRFRTLNRKLDIKIMKELENKINSENFNLNNFIQLLLNDPLLPYNKIIVQNIDYDKIIDKLLQFKREPETMKHNRYQNINFILP